MVLVVVVSIAMDRGRTSYTCFQDFFASQTDSILPFQNMAICPSRYRQHANTIYVTGAEQFRLLYMAMRLGDYRLPGMHFHAARRIFCRLSSSGPGCAGCMDGRYSDLLVYKLAIILYAVPIDAYSTASALVPKH